MGFNSPSHFECPLRGPLHVSRLFIISIIIFSLVPSPAAVEGQTPHRTAGMDRAAPSFYTADRIAHLRDLSSRYLARSVALREEALREAVRGDWPVRGITADGAAFATRIGVTGNSASATNHCTGRSASSVFTCFLH